MQHKQQNSEEFKTDSLIKLEQKLNKSLNKKLVISRNSEYIQDIEPIYIDIFIKIYHKSSHLEKILIFNELKKFNNNKTITFFYKLNDSEHNVYIINSSPLIPFKSSPLVPLKSSQLDTLKKLYPKI